MSEGMTEIECKAKLFDLIAKQSQLNADIRELENQKQELMQTLQNIRHNEETSTKQN